MRIVKREVIVWTGFRRASEVLVDALFEVSRTILEFAYALIRGFLLSALSVITTK